MWKPAMAAITVSNIFSYDKELTELILITVDDRGPRHRLTLRGRCKKLIHGVKIKATQGDSCSNHLTPATSWDTASVIPILRSRTFSPHPLPSPCIRPFSTMPLLLRDDINTE
ncbi:hypothetical protein FRC03_000319 [Tulasnella sp. 419]|nr:hypothetical protein FRC02_001681 [Tulasnella sp. 418]KAG8949500.1 hypothetical protein FRC03_000319 [Tulasnella sp. 419]